MPKNTRQSRIKYLLEYLSQLTGLIISLSAGVYIFGYIIVNAYLGKYHIIQTEVLRPAFISAGLFFIIMDIIAIVITVPIAKKLSELYLDLYQRSLPPASDSVGRGRLRTIDGIVLGIVYTFFAILITLLLEYLNASVISSISNIATWDPNKMGASLIAPFDPFSNTFYLLGSAGLILTFTVFTYNEIRKPVIRYIFASLTTMSFLLLEMSALLLIANQVYEVVPASIGGGKPQQVILLVDTKGAEYMSQIGYEINQPLISQTQTTDSDLVRTKEVLLFWQIGTADQSKSQSFYYIRPIDCDKCPVFQIPQENVISIFFIK